MTDNSQTSEYEGAAVRQSLRVLVAASSAPSLRQVWAALTREERARALWLLLEHGSGRENFVRSLRGVVERARNLRRQTVEAKSLRELSADAARCPAEKLPLEAALRELHLQDRRQILIDFLETAHIPHDDGLVDPNVLKVAPPSADTVRAAVEKLLDNYHVDEILIYLLTLLALETSGWEGVDDWRRRFAEQVELSRSGFRFSLDGPPHFVSAHRPGHSGSDTGRSAGHEHLTEASDFEVDLKANAPPTSEDSGDGAPSAGDIGEAPNPLDAKIAALAIEFRDIARRLHEAASQLENEIVPIDAAEDALRGLRQSFEATRDTVMASALPQVVVGRTLNGIRDLLEVLEEDRRARQQRKVSAMLLPAQPMLVELASLEGPAELSEFIDATRSQAKILLAALQTGQVAEEHAGVLAGLAAREHPLAALRDLARDEDLTFAQVQERTNLVRESYGEAVAVAAMRGRFTFRMSVLADHEAVSAIPSPEDGSTVTATSANGNRAALRAPAEGSEDAALATTITASDFGIPAVPNYTPPAVDPSPAIPDADLSVKRRGRSDEASAEAAQKWPADTVADPYSPTEAIDADDEAALEDVSEGSISTSDVALDPLAARHELEAWRALATHEPELAYYHAQLANSESLGQVRLPTSLVRAVCLAPHLQDGVGPIAEALEQDLLVVDPTTLLSVKDDTLQQALRLLVVAAGLRPSVLIPGSAAAGQLASLRHDGGFRALWELCNEVVAFAQGGLALAPDLLAAVSTSAAWADQVRHLRDEARAWLQHKAPAYRFQYSGATNVWRRMLEKGNLVDQLLRPVVENDNRALGATQERLEDLSSMEAIHRRIQRTDREQVGRPRGPDIHAGALRQLEAAILDALDLSRRWVQLQRVNPAGDEGWRLAQAGKLRAALLTLRAPAMAELDAARPTTLAVPARTYMRAAVTRCSRAIENLVSLFEPQRHTRGREGTPEQLLGMPLLMRPAARLLADGTVDVAASQELREALREVVDPDPSTRWSNAFDRRLAADDFIGTQLLLDHADALGYTGDLRERERKAEIRLTAIGNRRSSLRYDIDTVRGAIAQGAALGFLRESEHSGLLADVTVLEEATGASVDFSSIEGDLRAAKARLSNLRHAAVSEVRERVREALDLSDEATAKIKDLLDEGDILTATEVLQNRRQWSDALTARGLIVEPFPHFLSFLRRTQALDETVGAADLAMLDGLADALDQPEHVTRETELVLRGWTDRRKNAIDNGLTKRVFSLIGFNVVAPPQSSGAQPRWQEVKTVPVSDRSRCPVPFYGSRAEGHYNVLWLWGPTSPEDIHAAVAESDGKEREPTIVFYFGRLDEAQRRLLRLESLQKRTRFLVLDDVLLAFLARLTGARMNAFFSSTLPFSHLVPYHTLAGEVPVEMFYGRYQQREAIQDPDGTCLVYGGRQLGKTALLRDVQRSFEQGTNRIAVYIDLKAAGVGAHRPPSAVWDVLLNELRRESLPVPSPTKKTLGTAELVEQAIRGWINRSPSTNRILLLLDEADLFFKADGENGNFDNAHRFKAIMDGTQRAFKVVFAGLHNVQRSTRVVNHPLAHLGDPVCVGPMVEGAEWHAAVDLVERPLTAVGYAIDRDLTIRILSHTNYYPSIIQIYCGELVRHVNQSFNRWAAEKGALPVRITAQQVEDAYRSLELRQRIKQSFDLTLNLDPRYKVIALCVAEATVAREPWVHTPRDIGVSELRETVMAAWGDGFREDRSEDGFRALLEEMVGLGVLRRSAENRYALRGANVPLLLGSEEEVLEKLVSLDPPESYEFAPDTHRRPMTGAGARFGRAPLTTRQEFDLYAPSSGVAVVCGVAAAGLEEVARCLETGERVRVRTLAPGADASQLEEALHEAERRPVDGTVLIHVPVDAPWTETWIHHAIDRLRPRRSRERFIRVVFVAGPMACWQLVQEHGSRANAIEDLRALGIAVQSLEPWRTAVVRQWLEEQQLSTTHPAFNLQTVAARTGNWPWMLDEYLRVARARSRGGIIDPGDGFLEDLTRTASTDSLLPMFGLSTGEATLALRKLVQLSTELNAAVPLEDLVVLGEVDEHVAERTIAWADTLALIRLTPRKHGPASWLPDVVISALLKH